MLCWQKWVLHTLTERVRVCVCVISLEISAYLQFDGGKRVCLEYRVNMMWQINGCWIMRHGI